MRSHSVTCHPAEVTFPPLPQPKLVVTRNAAAAPSHIVSDKSSVRHLAFSSWFQVASQSYFSPVSHISLRDWLLGVSTLLLANTASVNSMNSYSAEQANSSIFYLLTFSLDNCLSSYFPAVKYFMVARVFVDKSENCRHFLCLIWLK